MIIGFCLGVMLLITFFAIIGGGAFGGYSDSLTVDGGVYVNGTQTTYSSGSEAIDFSIAFDINGAIILLIILATIIAIIGLQVLGSGLSDSSVTTLRTSIAYGGLWGVLSITAFPLINAISTFGWLIYSGLTFLFIIGVFQKLGANS